MVPTRISPDPHRPPSWRAVLLFSALFVLGLLLQASVVLVEVP